MKIKEHRLVLGVLIVGLLLRLGIAFWSFRFRENTDVLRYRDWVRIGYLYGLADTYKTDHLTFGTLPNNQPPGQIIVLSAAYRVDILAAKAVYRVFGHSDLTRAFADGPLLDFMLRIPSILADMLLAILLYACVSIYRSRRWAFAAASLWYFSPVVLYNSAVWGQLDSINTMFFLGSLFFLFKKRWGLALTFLACSLLVKLSLMYLLPLVFYILFLSTRSVWPVLKASAMGVLVTLVSVLAVTRNPIIWIGQFLQHNATGEMPDLSAFALNGWWAVIRPHIVFGPDTSAFSATTVALMNSISSDRLLWGVPISVWAVLLFCLFCLPFVFRMIRLGKRYLKPSMIPYSMGLLALLAYLWLPKMHERYMYPALALFALSIGLGVPIVWEYGVLLFLNFLNLLIVWHPFPLPYPFYALFSDQTFQWTISMITIILSIVLYGKFLRFLSPVPIPRRLKSSKMSVTGNHS
ncbi:hypothetical protein M1555_00100 [Patescibacteria group bacterium]|nr:hypothetical protein [Patescibacteria group bacterium]